MNMEIVVSLFSEGSDDSIMFLMWSACSMVEIVV